MSHSDNRCSGPRRRRLALRVFAVLLVGAITLAAVVALADWALERRELDAAAIDVSAASPPVTPADALKAFPALRRHLVDSLAWGPARLVPVLGQRALHAASASPRHPRDVFLDAARQAGADVRRADLDRALESGELLPALLRSRLQVGVVGGAYTLTRIAPDLRRGGLRATPGSVLLAFPRQDGWSYVLVFYPDGLALGDAALPMRRPAELGEGLPAPLDHPQMTPLAVLPSARSAAGVRGEVVLFRTTGPSAVVVASVRAKAARLGWRRRDVAVGGQSSLVLTRGSSTVRILPQSLSDGLLVVVLEGPRGEHA